MTKFYLQLYYLIGIHLPSSFFPLGKVFNAFRCHLLRHFMSIGANCRIQSHVYVGNGSNVKIGSHCQINENVRIRYAQIGDFVLIAPGVNILGPNHEFSRVDVPIINQGAIPARTTVIEDDVWLCTNCIIMNGVKIAKGCIIAAGAVVTKDCAPYCIYGGVPARQISTRK